MFNFFKCIIISNIFWDISIAEVESPPTIEALAGVNNTLFLIKYFSTSYEQAILSLSPTVITPFLRRTLASSIFNSFNSES